MKYTKKENVISFLLGLIISIPLCTLVFDTHTNYEVPTEPVETEETLELNSGISNVMSETLSNPPATMKSNKLIETESIPPKISFEDIDMLAHLLYGEAGSEWCSDEMIYGVGSVVLNRIASEHFPDTLEEVIFQEWQYECTWDGNYYREPTERYYKIAEDLLKNGSVLPENVLYQAQSILGSGVYKKVQNMYFCYQ